MKDYSAAAMTALDGDTGIAMFIRLDFDSGPQMYWTGGHDIDSGGYTWQGAGGVVEIGEIRETEQLIATTVPLKLSGLASSLISLLQSEKVRGRLCTLWFAPLDDAGNVIGSPPIEFRGKLDEPGIIIDGEAAAIAINVISRMADFARPRERRFSNEDQQAHYPGDTIFDGIHETAEFELVWPAKTWFARQ